MTFEEVVRPPRLERGAPGLEGEGTMRQPLAQGPASTRPAVPLLASQRFGGIDAEAASGRTQRREDADEQHERGRAGEDAGNRQAADLFDRHVPADEVGGEHPRRRTGTDLPERAPEHSRHQLARLGAQGRTDTDLTPALRDRERHERVQAGGREQQYAAGDRADGDGAKVVAEAVLAIDLCQRADLIDVQRRVDTRGDVAEAFSETGRTASQAKLQVRRMDLTRGRRMVRDPCVGRHGQIPDDTDDFVPAVRFRAVQPLAARRTDVPETVSERVAAGGDGLGEVAVDDDRIGLRGNVALL